MSLTVYRPHVTFHCDMDFDPFAYLHNNKKVYGKLARSYDVLLTDPTAVEGFNLAVYEWMETIPTLWPTVKGP